MPAGAVEGDGEVQRGNGGRGHEGAFLEIRTRAHVTHAMGCRFGERVSGTTERAGHALEVYVRPGGQVHGVEGVRHGRHLPLSGARRRLSHLVIGHNARAPPGVPGGAGAGQELSRGRPGGFTSDLATASSERL
ncbi:hypothetical protein JCM4814A_43850 [Streptomyces phaeofaciens JCM 4814]|uniref:Uncharacterized protein n=1 Tax=Streptomyces phaeofaciens TaxID=68254 RepID=A0A918H026_9ACTN|nr:hypothetical protein GCM10010226_00530 [Streptomyces phaeofaciens]